VTVRRGVSSWFSGWRNRQKMVPRPWPLVSSQLGRPGSNSLKTMRYVPSGSRTNCRSLCDAWCVRWSNVWLCTFQRMTFVNRLGGVGPFKNHPTTLPPV
jgi:hypothetical protein